MKLLELFQNPYSRACFDIDGVFDRWNALANITGWRNGKKMNAERRLRRICKKKDAWRAGINFRRSQQK